MTTYVRKWTTPTHTAQLMIRQPGHRESARAYLVAALRPHT